MPGIGQIVDEFVRQRRRPLPTVEPLAGQALAVGGFAVGPIGPTFQTVHAVKAGLPSEETLWAHELTEIDGSSWADLQSATRAPDLVLASAFIAVGTSSAKMIEVAPLPYMFPASATLTGFRAYIIASNSTAAGMNLRCQLYDGADNALGVQKTIAINNVYTEYSFGTSSDLWSAGLSMADLRADGIKLAVWGQNVGASGKTLSVDSLRLIVFYDYAA